MWFYDIINVIVAIAVIVAILYLLFRLFVLKQGNERVILLPSGKQASVGRYEHEFHDIVLRCAICEQRPSTWYDHGFDFHVLCFQKNILMA